MLRTDVKKILKHYFPTADGSFLMEACVDEIMVLIGLERADKQIGGAARALGGDVPAAADWKTRFRERFGSGDESGDFPSKFIESFIGEELKRERERVVEILKTHIDHSHPECTIATLKEVEARQPNKE